MRRIQSLASVLKVWCEQNDSLEAIIIQALLKAIPDGQLSKAEHSLSTALSEAGWHHRSVKAAPENDAPAALPGSQHCNLGDNALLQAAMEVILRDRRPTAEILERALAIGGAQARRLIAELEERGALGPPAHGYRQILYRRPKNSAGSVE